MQMDRNTCRCYREPPPATFARGGKYSSKSVYYSIIVLIIVGFTVIFWVPREINPGYMIILIYHILYFTNYQFIPLFTYFLIPPLIPSFLTSLLTNILTYFSTYLLTSFLPSFLSSFSCFLRFLLSIVSSFVFPLHCLILQSFFL